MTRLSDDITKPWIKANQKETTNLTNNQNFLVQDPDKGEPVNPYMDIYKAKVKSDGSLDKLTLRIMVRGYLQNKELFGDN